MEDSAIWTEEAVLDASEDAVAATADMEDLTPSFDICIEPSGDPASTGESCIRNAGIGWVINLRFSRDCILKYCSSFCLTENDHNYRADPKNCVQNYGEHCTS